MQDREYVKKEKGRLAPTSLGRTVNKIMMEFFPIIVDISFTAKMEERLDLIEDGKKDWIKSLERFNGAFEKELDSGPGKHEEPQKGRERDRYCL